MSHRFYTSFNSGEWDPRLDGRYDIDKYGSACRIVENWRLMEYGGVRYRTGFQYMAFAMSPGSRLFPFQFSVTTRFVLEFGGGAIGFFANKTVVNNPGGGRYTIPSPYLDTELFDIQFKQINDVMYLTHPNHPPMRLSRYGDLDWRLEEVEWKYPPMLDQNTDPINITVEGWKKGTTLVNMDSTEPLFSPEQVGGDYELKYTKESIGVELDLQATAPVTKESGALKVRGNYQITTAGFWWGRLEVLRSYDGVGDWEVVHFFIGSTDRNVSAAGTQDEEAWLKFRFVAYGEPFSTSNYTDPEGNVHAAPWKGTAPSDYANAKAKLESSEAKTSGIVKIRDYVSDTRVVVDIMSDLQPLDPNDDESAAKPTREWSEGAWSMKNGFPRAIGLYEQRLYFGGTRNNPIRFWGSRIGDFEDFERTSANDGAVVFDVASTESNMILWMDALDMLQIGTSGGEFVASSGNKEEAISPTNILVRGQSAYGSEGLQATSVNDSTLFVQRQGRAIREMSYDLSKDRYLAPEISQMSRELLSSGIVQTAFARQPDPLYMCVLGNGQIGVMTYSKDQLVSGWARWKTNGKFTSVASIYGSPEDEIWVVVQRSNGTFVEVMAPENNDVVNACHLDCSLSGIVPKVITGMTQFSGKLVSVVLNGSEVGDIEVGSNGVIDLTPYWKPQYDTSAPHGVIGYQYEAVLKLMKVDIGMSDGVSQGRKRRISYVDVRMDNSLGCYVGRSMEELEPIYFRKWGDVMDTPHELFTGDKNVLWPGGNDKSADIYIVQRHPHPCTVIGLAVNWKVHGNYDVG